MLVISRRVYVYVCGCLLLSAYDGIEKDFRLILCIRVF
jgi:hypothetical protein